MKTCFKNQFRCYLLLLALTCVPVGDGRASAQNFTVLYNFSDNSGGNPSCGLIVSGNTLYGTTQFAGSSGAMGTLFKINTDGTGFNILHAFNVFPNLNDGKYPKARLILSGNILYGTTGLGGDSNNGAVFAVNTDGTGFTILHSFSAISPPAYNNNDGAWPEGELILAGDTLYGTAILGGNWCKGTVFKVKTNGTSFTTLYSFSAASNEAGHTNSDGTTPYGGLLLSGNTLYGTTAWGGTSGSGSVFKLNTDGTGFTTLYFFTGGIDGACPGHGVLVVSSNTLYGTATYGGQSGNGTVFKLNTDGTSFTTLHTFTANAAPSNPDGAFPWDVLFLEGNTLYGTTAGGGALGYGTVFKLRTDGSDFTTLYNFSALGDGGGPEGGVVLSGSTLYGTTGNSVPGRGTIFTLSLGPVGASQLNLIPLGASIGFSWPTNVVGLRLQSTPNLGSSASWTAVSTQPVVVNGQNTVTNPISGAQQFFRLAQ